MHQNLLYNKKLQIQFKRHELQIFVKGIQVWNKHHIETKLKMSIFELQIRKYIFR